MYNITIALHVKLVYSVFASEPFRLCVFCLLRQKLFFGNLAFSRTRLI